MIPSKVVAINKQFPYWGNRPLTWLIGIMIAIYIPTHWPNLFAMPKDGSFSAKLMDWGLMQGDAVFNHGQYWRLLTAAFLHANFLHIFFNMTALFLFGMWARQYELSKYAWLLTFFVGAIVGNILTGVLKPDLTELGASGGIMALWGGYFAMIVRAHALRNSELRHVRHTLKWPSQTIQLAVQVVLLDHLLPNIGWQCHLGGLITGFVIGWFIPLRGELHVYASRSGLAELSGTWNLVTRKIKGRSFKDVERDIVIAPDFDRERDFVVTSTTWVDWRNRVHQKRVRVLAGHLKGKKQNWDAFAHVGRILTVAEIKYDRLHHDLASKLARVKEELATAIPHGAISEE